MAAVWCSDIAETTDAEWTSCSLLVGRAAAVGRRGTVEAATVTEVQQWVVLIALESYFGTSSAPME